MTEVQFRNSLFRQALAEFLSTPAGINLVVILKDGSTPLDPPIAAEPVASVRTLSQSVGFNACLTALLRMAEPNERTEDPPQETWGVDQPPATESGTM